MVNKCCGRGTAGCCVKLYPSSDEARVAELVQGFFRNVLQRDVG